MERCPFGRGVGEVPSILNCKEGPLMCPCCHHMMRYAFGIPSEVSMRVVGYWQQHPNPPEGDVPMWREDDE